ncbi:MAG: class I tRNA ligase family protein, partial [Candidatus Hydrogenedentes bacterium]|nr:class I tRNA ligase family protein [Candidatus Hydrogenedentota bacterium]
RYHNELGNDLGNLLNRTVSMMQRYRDGILPKPGSDTEAERALKSAAHRAWETVDTGFDQWMFSEALSELWRFVGAANRYVDATKPYVLAAEGDMEGRLDTILYNLAEGVRNAALLAAPAIPETSNRMYAQLGLPTIEGAAWLEQRAWGGLSPGSRIPGGAPIFPRLV